MLEAKYYLILIMNCLNNTGFFKPAQIHQRTSSQAEHFRGQQQKATNDSS
jgi:hypothetical protein